MEYFLQNVLKIKRAVLAHCGARETLNCCSLRMFFSPSPCGHTCRTMCWCLALSRRPQHCDMRHGGLWVLQAVPASQPQLHPCSPSELRHRGQVETTPQNGCRLAFLIWFLCWVFLTRETLKSTRDGRDENDNQGD